MSSRTNSPEIDVALLLLRVGIGLSLVWVHGFAKLNAAGGYLFSHRDWAFVHAVAGIGFPAAGVFACLAALAESVGALCVAAGLLTRYAAAVVAFNMVIAMWTHVRGGQSAELAYLYFVPVIAIAVAGGGAYSLDALLRRFRASAIGTAAVVSETSQ